MTREEAIKALERAEGYIGIHYVNGVEDPYINPCLLKAIDFAVAALQEQEDRRWIPVTERLPEEKLNCIVHYKHAYCDNDDYWEIGICFYDGEKFQLGPAYKVTHWMPLPDPPKEDT